MGYNDGCDRIREADNASLAEMLETHNRWRRGDKPYDRVGVEMPFNSLELGVLLDEAAARLRAKPRERFNSDAFNV